ncbi:hypothetical protein BJ741DRAFT_614129 [Chytriomyces cf. hyalinus JEL632]|nr:hypothetical protein BJ741DRAFT_614129 [Chytriomyces cf. hyalinus JEL632]
MLGQLIACFLQLMQTTPPLLFIHSTTKMRQLTQSSRTSNQSTGSQTSLASVQSHDALSRKANLQTVYSCLILAAVLSLTMSFSLGVIRGPALIPEYGFELPADSVRRLSISSHGVGYLTVKVLQGTGVMASFGVQIESDNVLQIEASSVLFVAQNSDGFVEIGVRFPATSWLPFFRSRHHITLFINAPSNISDLSVIGNAVSVVYMGPNIARSITVSIMDGSITFLSQISTASIDIETVKGSITFAQFSSASDSVRLRTGVGDMTGTLAQFKSLHASSNVGNFDMSLTAGVENATVILKFGDGHISSQIDSFRGKLGVFYRNENTEVLYGGVEWPPISLYPFVTWVNGVGIGRGVCNVTLKGAGSIYVNFGKLPSFKGG